MSQASGEKNSVYSECQGAKRTHCYVGPEELVVPEKRAHVLHAAFLLHAVTDVGLEPGAKLNT